MGAEWPSLWTNYSILKRRITFQPTGFNIPLNMPLNIPEVSNLPQHHCQNLGSCQTHHQLDHQELPFNVFTLYNLLPVQSTDWWPTCSTLSEHIIVRPEQLSERSWSHRIHGSGFEVHQNCSRYIFATCNTSTTITTWHPTARQIRPAQPFLWCRQLRQNLVHIQARRSSIHIMKNATVHV